MISAVYLRAAEIIDADDWRSNICGCCDAINFVVKNDAAVDCPAKDEFESLFAPENASSRAYWGERWSDSENVVRACRVLALCLMAAITEKPC